MKKASEAEVVKTSASTSKLDLVHSLIRSYIRTLENMITRMPNLWKLTSVVLHFHHGSPKVHSLIMAPSTWIFSLNTRILNPNTQNNLKGCVLLEPRNTRTKRNTRVGQNSIHSLHLQRRINPLSLSKSLLSLNSLLLSKINNRITQTQSFTGR